MPIYDADNNLIIKAVFKALSKPDTVEVKNRTLDGNYHIQTTGLGGTTVDVTAYLDPSEKLVLDNIKRRSGIITVVFSGDSYTGVIDGGLSYDRLPASNALMYSVSFTLLVQS